MRDERRYVNAYLENERAIAALWRDAQGALRVDRVGAEWVAYAAREGFPEDLLRQLRTSRNVASVKEEGTWLRVAFRGRWARQQYCQREKRVDADTGEVKFNPFLARGIEWREADVHPIRRWLSDTGALVARPRRCYLDLETDSRCRIVDAIEGKARIVAWAVCDREGNRSRGVLESDDDAAEVRLLAALAEALAPYDQLCAWGGDTFDEPVLRNRWGRLGTKVDARRWCWLDLLKVYARMNQHVAKSGEEKQRMGLQWIAVAELGEGKHDFDAAETWEAWEEGGARRQEMSDYNAQDADLLRRIDDKTGYADLFVTICEVCRLFGESKSLHPSRQMDGFLLRLGQERGYRFASRAFIEDGAEESEEPEEQYAGAWVLAPKRKGIIRDVHVADFKSLYPSVILSWNMSPDTKAQVPNEGPVPPGHCRSPSTGVGFRVDLKGILAEAVRELIRLRDEWKKKKKSFPPGTPEWHDADRRSMAYKVAANAFYGVLGNRFSRYFDVEMAESITQNGVWLIRKTIIAAEARGWGVIYGDTDSIFVVGCSREEFGEFCEWCNRELYPAALARQGCVENHVSIAYEKAFARLVLVTAKRYCASYLHYDGKDATEDSKPEVKGLEYKRGDATRLARELQIEVVDMLVGGLRKSKVPAPTEELQHYHESVARMRDHVLQDALPLDEIVVVKSLKGSTSSYEVKQKADGTDAAQPPHVVAAKMLEARGEGPFAEGARIEYVIADASESPQKVIPARDYDGRNADRYYVWESQVFPPTLRLLEAAFPEHDWDSWARVRPRKPRAAKPAAEGQAVMFAAHAAESPMCVGQVPSVPRAPRGDEPYVMRVAEPKLARGMGPVREVVAKHPGKRPLVIVVHMLSGAEVVLDTELRVDGSQALHAALLPFRPPPSVAS